MGLGFPLLPKPKRRRIVHPLNHNRRRDLKSPQIAPSRPSSPFGPPLSLKKILFSPLNLRAILTKAPALRLTGHQRWRRLHVSSLTMM
jgi:hypothetical protein